jgi:hypothetical protein
MDIKIIILTIGYIVWNISLNWMWIREYIGKGVTKI